MDPYSYRIYPSVAAGGPVAVPFPFIRREHVHVFLDGAEVPPTDYSWNTDGEILLRTGNSGEVIVRRITFEDDQLVRWKNGSYVVERDLNLSDLQWLYLIQEHHDTTGRIQEGLPALPGEDVPEAALYGLWNRFPRYLDPAADTPQERAHTVALPDQQKGEEGAWASLGWRSDDAHVATTGAMAERWDVIVSDETPPIPDSETYRQSGKFWINTSTLKLHYWLPGQVQAWVELPLRAGGGGDGGGGGIALSGIEPIHVDYSSPDSASVGIRQATTQNLGSVRLAGDADIDAGTPGKVVDASQLKDLIDQINAGGPIPPGTFLPYDISTLSLLP